MVIVIVTDNGFAAEAIRHSFQNTSGVRVAGYVDGRHACGTAVAGAQPDLVIVDEMTWSASALARIAEIRVSAPSAKIVALSSQPGACFVQEAARAGAHAAIAKTVQPGTLALLVREIWAGTVHHAFEGVRAAASPSAEHATLTPRELEILRLVAAGSSNGRIASQLWVTEQTVKFHLSNVYRKLGVSNRTEASHYAHVHALLDPRTADAIREQLGSGRAAA
jgi:DNA-binding NarL/FixJ family response regulator